MSTKAAVRDFDVDTSMSAGKLFEELDSSRLKQKKRTPRVLVVDDDNDQLQLFSVLLRTGGYETVLATNVEDAIRALEDLEIDCIVCDLYMPVLNGAYFVNKLRSTKAFAEIPFIVMTIASADLEAQMLQAGADAYCPKDMARTRLITQIELLLDR